METTTVGIDLAKSVFHLWGEDDRGRCVERKKLRREELLADMGRRSRCVVAMEACAGAHYWARRFQAQGHTVRLMAPRYVKGFVRGQKNDYNDAQAICEAGSRVGMREVAVKSEGQQALQALHRYRRRLMRERTALVNQARGLLLEFGVVIARGVSAVRVALPRVGEQGELEAPMRELCAALYEELCEVEQRLAYAEQRLAQAHRESETSCQLAELEGIGLLSATALVAKLGDAQAYRNGRAFAAALGLVPRQHSTGGKPLLLGISKQGDRYLRTLLIHGARAALRTAGHKTDRRSRWVTALAARRGFNRACVALANKNARIAWAMVAHAEPYRRA